MNRASSLFFRTEMFEDVRIGVDCCFDGQVVYARNIDRRSCWIVA